jgi:hypothetical protein
LRILAKAASFLANFVAASCFCFFCQQTKESPRQRNPAVATTNGSETHGSKTPQQQKTLKNF